MKLRVVTGALALLALAPALFGSFEGARAQAQDYTLRAGDGEVGYAVNEFLPGAIYVEPGDTVRWTFPWFEPHSVTIGQPTSDIEQPTHPGDSVVDFSGTEFVNSALIFGNPASPPSFSIRFNNAGAYNYYCYIHPNMTGTVNVLGPGQGIQDEQVAIDGRGNSEYQSAIAGLKSLGASLAAKPATVTPKQGGGRTFSLTVAGETLNGDVMQFFPPTVNVAVNDAVEWVSDVHTPHTVTFGELPGPPPGGDIFAVPPTKPAATYDGTGFWHSGIIGLDFPSGQRFSMTFSKAGSYTYVCILHADQGMVGTVNVAAQVAPGAPSTGSGLAESSGSRAEGILLIAAIASLAGAFTGLTLYTARR